MRLENEKINGFICSDPEIRIFDSNNRLFYLYKTKRIKTRFNLPKGVFYTENDLKQLDKPIQYKLIPLPKKNFNQSTFPDIKIIYENNPNKCSIYLDKGLIIFDNSFKDYPKFILNFILYHELGHFFYRGEARKSEINCDKFAAYHMLKRGYNPSQIKLAQHTTLKDEVRKDCILKHLEKIKI